MTRTHRILHTIAHVAWAPIRAVSLALKALWQKIRRIAIAIFSCFPCFHSTQPSPLINREITVLSSDGTHIKPHPLAPQKKRIVRPLIPAHLENRGLKKPPEAPPYITFDPALEELRSVFRDFSELISDAIYNKFLAKPLSSLQEKSPTIAPTVKSCAQLLIEMGDRGARPLYQKFTQQKRLGIDPTIQKLLCNLIRPDTATFRDHLSHRLHEKLNEYIYEDVFTADDYVNPVIEWIFSTHEYDKDTTEISSNEMRFQYSIVEVLKEEARKAWNEYQNAEREVLYRHLESSLRNEFKDLPLKKKEDLLNDYIRPIVTWLLLTNRTTPLADILHANGEYNEQLADKIFEHSIALLVNRKIDHYAAFVEHTVHRQLAEIVQEVMRVNASRIADFFSERLAILITSQSFSEMFDTIIRDVVAVHVKGVIRSEESALEHQQQLAQSTELARITSAKGNRLISKNKALKHLHLVEMHGDAPAYLEHMALEKFGESPGCAPAIKRMIEQHIEITLRGVDPTLAGNASEELICENIAEKLLNLLVRKERVPEENGAIKEIDPLIELWERLYFSEEFKGVVDQFKALLHELIPSEFTSLFGGLKTPIDQVAKTIFISQARDLAKKNIVKVVQIGFEKLVNPTCLDELFAGSILPSIDLQMIKSAMRRELRRHLDEFAPLLRQLVMSRESNRSVVLRNLQDRLIAKTKEQFRRFDPKKFQLAEAFNGVGSELMLTELSEAGWLDMSQVVVVDCEREIRQAKVNNAPVNIENLTVSTVSGIIKSYFSTNTNNHNDPVYGEMVKDILFKIGGMDYERAYSFFIEKSVSTAITSSCSDMRSSHRYLVSILAQLLKDTLVSPDKVNTLFSDTPSQPAVHTEQRLAHQIMVTAEIASDIIGREVAQSGFLTRFLVNNLVNLPSPDRLSKLTTTIYHGFFKRKVFNLNLLSRITHVILDHLEPQTRPLS